METPNLRQWLSQKPDTVIWPVFINSIDGRDRMR
jgi:hypothetical protein